ncbi:unnamed protein product [Phytomonas sp. Hart1]|nr:unnamed protein product [Phytomonas sp. Hart1]|eukprot:CCW69631.1 unnamed protein product [Phytomonas sp. isolate Hart1]
MIRRLHTRIIGMGSVCGLAPSPPAEVFLKTLPPPSEIDPVKYRRFQREEEAKEGFARGSPPDAPSCPVVGNKCGRTRATPRRAPEPFYDIVNGAAGHKHVVLVTREGHLITFGDNHYAQTAAPRDKAEAHPARVGGPSAPTSDWDPWFIPTAAAFHQDDGAPLSLGVACGTNFTIVYERGGRRAIAFGNNHIGQLGVGHKDTVGHRDTIDHKDTVSHRDSMGRGVEEWGPGTGAGWGPPECRLRDVTCGYNHSVATLQGGLLFAFGSNTWGELAIGTTTSPMWPTRIEFFEKRNIPVKKVCCGNSITVFLTEEGRVYGCGATNYGQLPYNAFEPVPIPLIRTFIDPGTSETTPRTVERRTDGQKLIRIRDIACAGSLVVFLSSKNEIFIQGALPEFGVLVPSPRLAVVDQTAAICAFKESLKANSSVCSDIDGFSVEEMVSSPSSVLVRYRNGCVGALGSNSEGQLYNVRKVIHGRSVNLAPSFASTSLFPMYTPTSALSRGVWKRSWLTCGSGFSLLVDVDEVYSIYEQVQPIELPPGEIIRMTDAMRKSLLKGIR